MKLIIPTLFISITLSACGIYSFTGASIPKNANTFSVNYFTTNITNYPSSLNHLITEGLKDLLLSQTNLSLTELESDLIFSGNITKYKITPIAIQANEIAGKNRLTIELKVNYKNNLNKKLNFDSVFSRYRDFNTSENLSDVEDILIEEIIKEILQDIFNKAFVNW